MSKRITQRSDGSWEVVSTTHPLWRALGWFFGALFVLVMAVRTWWLGIAILLLVVAAAVGKMKSK